jgi:hypothetical protein
MNKLRRAANWIVCGAIIFLLGGISAVAQIRELNAQEVQVLRKAVASPAAVHLWAVTEEFTGNFDIVDRHLATMMKDVESQKLNAQLGASPTAILILREDPTGKQQFRMSVGFQVPKRLAVKAPLTVEQMSYKLAVRHTHVGPYAGLEQVHGNIVTGLREAKPAKGAARQTDWPVLLFLHSDPKKVKPEQLQTEMLVPIH